MLSRRIQSRVAGTAVAASTMMAQRRFDHDRWYGHSAELDIGNYRYTGVRPKWMRPDPKTHEEIEGMKKRLPHIDFAGTYELLLWDADRLNYHINRKEFGNEIKTRLEKQANLVSRAQQLIKGGEYKDIKVEDTMIARIADEEHIQAEMKHVKTIRANELAEDNRLDILPGGSPMSLREKTRWNLNMELHPIDRAEIAHRLVAWLPEKYHVVYFDDMQTVAANDSTMRGEMQAIVNKVEKDHAEEAKANGWEKDLKEVVTELQDDIDPTRHITKAAIEAQTSLDTLEEWSRLVHEYNGDSRILDIYAKAAALTKNEEHAALVKEMRSLMEKKVQKA